ncbi:glucose-6-phosphate isomerase [Anaeramoeba flamelloides]|uniref:Glucose-6-phosphate isomerase n=1 Tax=Anaeramoeba flamelloides TaxID=1746091 RepID=A0AAV7ZVN6_9EUKA|nr:glucose-6-phosphate isomerase [Anaeramoeba flamelloides]
MDPLKNYSEGYFFHCNETDFTLDYSGMVENKEKLLTSHSDLVNLALDTVQKIEKGEIVNKTEVTQESENRAVDHYNLRMKKELVEGKSLSISLKYNAKIVEEITPILKGELKAPNGQKYTDVIFNGIGGSSLGPYMLVISQYGIDYNTLSGLPMKLHFTSNTDPDSFSHLIKKLDLNTTILVSISKSGTTSETKGNLEAFTQILKDQGIEKIGAHMIAITTADSLLDKFAKKNQFLASYVMNVETGGRTSICSAVGMVPAAFAQINFEEFLKGQSTMDEMTRRPEVSENPAMIISLAIEELTHNEKHKNMIMLCYSDFLKEFPNYLQQLYMESIGKNYDIFGKTKHEGQTIFGGVGTMVQHAFMQQVQKGIKDCFVRFLNFRKRKSDFLVESSGSMGRQLLGFVKGTESALTKNNVPFFTTTFKMNNPFNVGMMVALEERIVTFIGAFRQINCYDQPGVQAGKLACKHFNALSKIVLNNLIEYFSNENNSFTGEAKKYFLQFAKTQDKKEFSEKEILGDSIFVDALLSDIDANIEIDKSYNELKKLITIERVMKENKFIYTITKK